MELKPVNSQIYIGAIDDELTEKGYISPGLGDSVGLSWSCPSFHRNLMRDSIGRQTVQHSYQIDQNGRRYAGATSGFG